MSMTCSGSWIEVVGKSAMGTNISKFRVQEQGSISLGASMIGLFLAFLQALDGVLTSWGMHHFGTEMEGNILLRNLMEEFGSVPTLAICKFLAILIVVFLTIASKKIPWVTKAMGFVSCIYVVFAIIPWTYLYLIENAII